MADIIVKEILKSSNYWVLNKHLVKELGIEPAFILTVFAEAEESLADEQGWFYQTAETVEEITGLSTYKQGIAIQELIDKDVLEHKNKGMPMRRFFRIKTDTIHKLVFKKLENLLSKNSQTSFQKISNNKEPINKEPINKTLNIKERKKEITSYDEIIDELVTDEKVKETLFSFLKMRKFIKEPPTDDALRLIIAKMKRLGKTTDEQIEILNNSIENNYRGIFPLKDSYQGKVKTTTEPKEEKSQLKGVVNL